MRLQDALYQIISREDSRRLTILPQKVNHVYGSSTFRFASRKLQLSKACCLYLQFLGHPRVLNFAWIYPTKKKTIWPQTDLCLFLFIIDQTRISMKEKAKSTKIMLRLTPLLLFLEDVSVLTNRFSLAVRIDRYLPN